MDLQFLFSRESAPSNLSIFFLEAKSFAQDFVNLAPESCAQLLLFNYPLLWVWVCRAQARWHFTTQLCPARHLGFQALQLSFVFPLFDRCWHIN